MKTFDQNKKSFIETFYQIFGMHSFNEAFTQAFFTKTFKKSFIHIKSFMFLLKFIF